MDLLSLQLHIVAHGENSYLSAQLVILLGFLQVSYVRMLSGERVLTAGHDGTIKMWDVRTDTCVATVGRSSGAVLCVEYNDSTGILAAGSRDSYVI